MNIRNDLRSVAFDMHLLDLSSDGYPITKNASVFKRVLNFFKGWGDPEYQEKLKELKEVSPDVYSTSTNLSREVKDLNKAIESSDPEAFGKSIERLIPLVSELSEKLSEIDSIANKVLSDTPAEKVVDREGNLIDPSKYITHVSKDSLKEEGVIKTLHDQLPKDLDVPVSYRILAPVKNFEWFKKFSESDVSISPYTLGRVVDKIKELLFNREILTDGVDKAIDSGRDVISESLKKNILGGTLVSYYFPKSGVANRMIAIIDAGVISIPGTTILVRFPVNILLDKYASVFPEKVLELISFKNISLVSFDSQDPLITGNNISGKNVDSKGSEINGDEEGIPELFPTSTKPISDRVDDSNSAIGPYNRLSSDFGDRFLIRVSSDRGYYRDVSFAKIVNKSLRCLFDVESSIHKSATDGVVEIDALFLNSDPFSARKSISKIIDTISELSGAEIDIEMINGIGSDSEVIDYTIPPTYTESLRRLRMSRSEKELKKFQEVFKRNFDLALEMSEIDPEAYALERAWNGKV